MATEKDNEFLNYLYSATDSGKVKWQPAAEPDRFVTSFKGKYNVAVDKTESDEVGTFYYVKLTDDADQELLKVFASENRLVKELFYLARRRSLNVDSAIDEIMGLASDSKDDVPF
jgi:hypothetical protein